MHEGKAPINGVDIWYERFGDPALPTVLLLADACAQATQWRAPFFDPLVVAGFHVVRFDARDVGLSTWPDFEARPYTLETLTADAVGLLDTLDVARAHWVGLGMGAMVAQCAAIRHPERVRTLTSIHASPSGPGDAALPGPSAEVAAALARLGPGHDAMERQLALWRALCGSRFGFDEAAWRRKIQDGFDRGFNPACAHARAVAAAPSRRAALGAVRTPTLVIHGDEDPLLPPAHGRATAEAIPGARWVLLPGIGHELPEAALSEVLDPILAHLEAADR